MIQQHRLILAIFVVPFYAASAGAQSLERSAPDTGDRSRERSESRRLPLLPAAQLPSGLPGVTPGTIEAGLFGQYSYFGENADFSPLDSRGAGGFGGRIGFFLTEALSVEVDAVASKLELEPVPNGENGGSVDRDVDHLAIAVRGNVNFVPAAAGDRMSVILGVGPVRSRYSHTDRSDTKWGVSGLAGGRLMVSDPIALRGDVVIDYLPGSSSVNVGARLGLSILFGTRPTNGTGRTAEVDDQSVAPPVVQQPVEPAPPPAAEEDQFGGAALLSTAEVTALNEPIFFDYDQAAVRPDAAAILDRKIPVLLARGGFPLRIEGHADDRGQDEYNLSLGQRRAAETRDYMIQRGVPASRLPIVSYGEEFKKCVRDPMTEECHQQNRRAEFRILGPGDQ